MVNIFIQVKAIRNYDIFPAGICRCDLCKGYKECEELVPDQKLHNFDNIFLCKICLIRCGFEIREGVLNESDDDKTRD